VALKPITEVVSSMSFRARLTVFFVVIVVIPMTLMGVLGFELIDSAGQSKADARAAGIAGTARSVYESDSHEASLEARTVARSLAYTPVSQLSSRVDAMLASTGLARIVVHVGQSRTITAGSDAAIAPGIAAVRSSGGDSGRTFVVSEVTASQYADQLAGTDTVLVVRSGGATIGTSDGRASHLSLPAGVGAVSIGSEKYRFITQRLSGFDGSHVDVSVLSALGATSASVRNERLLAGGLIGALLLLAFCFTQLMAHFTQSQVSHFLKAARRLGSGDFSEPVQTVGHDEFAALGQEFNSMSRQLQTRMDELEQERARFRAAVRRIGEAFASGLDRDALLELALSTAIDATGAEGGRVSARRRSTEPLEVTGYVGNVTVLDAAFAEAESRAEENEDGVGLSHAKGAHVAAVAIWPREEGEPTQGVITVSRAGRPFGEDDHELLRSLASRASLALANVDMHDDVARQAVTDDLTGLASHGLFRARLDDEMRQASRYHHPVAIAMFDIDNFKAFNDTYGHQQGDLVLRRVAEVLSETCREADLAARYGGEEMALILPHTDLQGAHELAERARLAIERLSVPRLDGQGSLSVTTSAGVAAGDHGRGDTLVAAADTALYAAKRAGKNRTVRAGDPGADAVARELAGATERPDGE
jgi:diguanylate cyclase (GGDEF)-like protein